MGAGLSRCIAAGVAAALLPLSVASAAAQTEPFYPEIILETDDSYSADAELTAFRRALIEASGTVVATDFGKQLDPDALLPFLADDVEFFVGQGGLPYREEFVSLGLHPARRALEMAGHLSRRHDSADPVVHSRYGLYALARLAHEPTVGRTPWLKGRICTASYGRISWPDWIALDGKLRLMDRQRWAIAAVVRWEGAHGLPPGDWPKRYQMVPVSPEQKRSGGSIGIITPQGGTVFFRVSYGQQTSHFAPYLNSHLCFEQRDGAWRVSAIAMRLD